MTMRVTFLITLSLFLGFGAFADTTYAATLRLSPETGVYTAGGTFTAQVLINTQGKPVNAADAQLSFNPRELSVVSVSRGSIFNLWTQEPTFSNTAGTISFGGGSPSGYTGSAGSVMSVTFRALAAGSPKVTFKSGSVLAADGMGTNVLTSMAGGSYTISAKAETPEPEYIAPANTPAAPKITSTTHPDEAKWYGETTAKLSWTLPSDVVAVRMLLDENRGTIPTNVYEERITSREITDLPQGVSYFHIQFKNGDGWGKVTHYRLAVDSEESSEFKITAAEGEEDTDPERTIVFTIKDVSPIVTYRIQVDGGEPIVLEGEKATSTYTLPRVGPGDHTVVVEAFDSAGNSRVATYTFTTASFERPVFTEYPTRMSTGVIPAIKGTSRPDATVSITMKSTDGAEKMYEVTSDAQGVFVFIPDTSLVQGVYDITAQATDKFGAQSELSEAIRVIVEEPGYMRIGSYIVSVLSIVVPMVGMLFLLVFGTIYLYHRMRVWRKKVRKETADVSERLTIEFNEIITNLRANVAELKESRKGKLTKAESALIEQIEYDIEDARTKIKKEITDIEEIT